LLDLLKKYPQSIIISAHKKKALKIGMLAFIGTVLILSALFFSLRNVILKNILANKIGSYQFNHEQSVLSIGVAKFSGLDRIVFENIRLQANTQNLAVDLKSCAIKFGFWKMFIGQVQPKYLQIDDLRIDLNQDKIPAQDFPRLAGTKAAKKINRTIAYSAQVSDILDLFFKRIPGSLKIKRLTVNANINNIRQTFYIPQLAINDLDFETMVQIENQEKKWACHLAGNIDRKKKQLTFKMFPLRSAEKVALPFIDQQWGVRVSLNYVEISLKSDGLDNGVLQLHGLLAVNGLTLSHPRIAAEDVNLQNAAVDYVLHIGADFIELDNRTQVQFNQLTFNPYFKFKVRPTKQLTLKLNKTKFKADDFFSSLPAGLFNKLAGIKTSGELAFELNFFIDFTHPELLSLESDLEKDNFKIERFGRVDFTTVNKPFLYTAYEKDQALRSFMVGPENPDFRTLDQFPSFLKDAVMLSEDGAFWWHKGFLLEPFKDSIVANLREKRFVRGASTISMQLVKNLYLKRQKTIARKLEEMLITWLIEENRLVAKERMYEIYLNIIEWGPLVYGAQEAAHFYFAKDVAELTLAEAIFMASIVPRPKKFMYSFDQDQRLRPWLQAYYSDVAYKMLKREMISQQDYDTLIPDIRLKGPARFLLKGNEKIPDELLGQAEEIVE
jgi:hypothetical protein